MQALWFDHDSHLVQMAPGTVRRSARNHIRLILSCFRQARTTTVRVAVPRSSVVAVFMHLHVQSDPESLPSPRDAGPSQDRPRPDRKGEDFSSEPGQKPLRKGASVALPWWTGERGSALVNLDGGRRLQPPVEDPVGGRPEGNMGSPEEPEEGPGLWKCCGVVNPGLGGDGESSVERAEQALRPRLHQRREANCELAHAQPPHAPGDVVRNAHVGHRLDDKVPEDQGVLAPALSIRFIWYSASPQDIADEVVLAYVLREVVNSSRVRPILAGKMVQMRASKHCRLADDAWCDEDGVDGSVELCMG